jgi:hypothetical protein
VLYQKNKKYHFNFFDLQMGDHWWKWAWWVLSARGLGARRLSPWWCKTLVVIVMTVAAAT